MIAKSTSQQDEYRFEIKKKKIGSIHFQNKMQNIKFSSDLNHNNHYFEQR